MVLQFLFTIKQNHRIHYNRLKLYFDIYTIFINVPKKRFDEHFHSLAIVDRLTFAS